MSVPETTRKSLRDRLWQQADKLGWAMLSPTEKSRHYETWTRHPEVGGRLSRYMDQGQVRVYIKDTLLKDYTRARLAGWEKPFRVLGICASANVVESYTKPHGRRFDDGGVVCWGRADDWKTVLMALHERTFDTDAHPYAAVFLFSVGRYHDEQVRRLVEEAARKLGIKRVIWLGS